MSHHSGTHPTNEVRLSQCIYVILKCLSFFSFCLHRLAGLFFIIKTKQNKTIFAFTDGYFMFSFVLIEVQSQKQNHYEYYRIRTLLYKTSFTPLSEELGSKGLKITGGKFIINPGVNE